jgi:formate dehydrogenase maturation protein FdhE
MPQPKQHPGNAARQAAYRQRLKVRQEEQSRHKGMPPLASIPTMPSEARWKQMLQMAAALLEGAVTEMADYADARSSAWQESERGEAFAERLETLTQLSEQLDSAL